MLKASVVAVVVSTLIWIWAERESLASRTTEAVQVSFPSDPANELVIRPVDARWNGTVQITLEGSVRSVDRAAADLGRAIKLPASLKGMPINPTPSVELDLRTPIGDLPALANVTGIVGRVEPSKVLVAVEKMVTRTLPVRVVISKSLPIDGDPVATPATVDVRLSELAARGLAADAVAIATVAESETARLRTDGPQTLTATIRLPETIRPGAVVQIRPETVSVSIRLRQTLDTVKVPTVPVWFSLPPTEDGAKWKIELLDKFLTDVTVSGPSEDIQRIRAGQAPVKAVVEFSSNELERAAADKTEVAKQVAFAGLPPGVTCTVANPTVRARVAKQ